MAYSAPSLQQPIVLQGGYQAPSLSIGVVLDQGGVALVTATVSVVLSAPAVAQSLSGAADVGALGVIEAGLVADVPGVRATASGVVGITYYGAASASLPAPVISRFEASCTGQAGTAAALAVGLSVPQMQARAVAGGAYDIALPEADGVCAAMSAQAAQPVASVVRQAQQSTALTRTAGLMATYHGQTVSTAAVMRAASMLGVRRIERAHHQHGLPLRAGAGSRQQSTRALQRAVRVSHQHALSRCGGTRIRQTSTLRPGRGLMYSEQQAETISKGLPARQHDRGAVLARPLRVRWQQSTSPLPGRWWPWYEPPGLVLVIPGPPYTPRPLKCAVVLGAGYAVQPPCDYNPPQQPGIVIPVRRTYIVLDSVSLRRLDSSIEVGALSVDISIDRSSWVCSWSAAVPANEWPALAAKAGEPLEIEAVINGRRWVLLMEGHPSRTRSFGEVAVKISGRGHAAWLSAPYAPSESRMPTTDMTAQQLMELALTTNGVSLGWTIDWQVTDWLVPAGAWSHFGSPIDGLLDVAGAISATVQADASAKIIHVLPRYPAAPWELESLAPDIEIPVDALDGDSFEPIVLPAYNAVYLSGQTHGVIGHVTRRGTAGDLQADMITHPLMTAAEAIRQRGIAELGNTGRQARVSITLDISDDMPLLAVGQVSSFPEAGDPWRGVVAGVSVSAAMDGDALVVSQRAEIERFFPEAV